MKKYIKLIAGVAAFVLLIAGANALYSNLTENYGMETELITEETDEGTVEETVSEDPAQAEQTAEEETSQNQAVDFSVEDAAGEEVTLFSRIGKPIVLNFWASWCGPCKMELPDFQSAYEKYGDEVEFMLVNMTDGMRETKEVAAEFMESEGYTMPIYFDTSQSAAYTYGVYSIPTTYFISADGEVVAGAQGMINADALEEGISMIYEGSREENQKVAPF